MLEILKGAMSTHHHLVHSSSAPARCTPFVPLSRIVRPEAKLSAIRNTDPRQPLPNPLNRSILGTPPLRLNAQSHRPILSHRKLLHRPPRNAFRQSLLDLRVEDNPFDLQTVLDDMESTDDKREDIVVGFVVDVGYRELGGLVIR